jgi:integrase
MPARYREREELFAAAVGHQKSIIRQAIERLDRFRGIGESRRDAKRAMREASGERRWTISTGKIHSHTTRRVYQQQVLAFVNWTREGYGITRLEDLDERADELATAYLQLHLDEGKSAYTLQTERSALRLFFQTRTLAQTVALPRRSRTAITRSRGLTAHDRHLQAANWQPLIRLLAATGLRRNEVRLLLVGDIVACESDPDYAGQTTVRVRNGKGGKPRIVPVLAGHEQEVLCLTHGRQANEHVFATIPKHLDVHGYRRAYAQSLYLALAPGRSLPPAMDRLKPGDYDAEAVLKVSQALGHRRREVVLHHYLR